MMDDRDLRTAVRALVMREFYVADPAALRNEQSLLLSGIVDSTGVIELTALLVDAFGIAIEPEEISPRNLDTIDRIVAFVASKRAPGPRTAADR